MRYCLTLRYYASHSSRRRQRLCRHLVRSPATRVSFAQNADWGKIYCDHTPVLLWDSTSKHCRGRFNNPDIYSDLYFPLTLTVLANRHDTQLALVVFAMIARLSWPGLDLNVLPLPQHLHYPIWTWPVQSVDDYAAACHAGWLKCAITKLAIWSKRSFTLICCPKTGIHIFLFMSICWNMRHCRRII